MRGEGDGQALGTRVGAGDDVGLYLEVEQTQRDRVHQEPGPFEELDLQHEPARLLDAIAAHLDRWVQPPICAPHSVCVWSCVYGGACACAVVRVR